LNYRQLIIVLLHKCFLFGATATLAAPPPTLEPVILDTHVNHQSYGQHFFFLDPSYHVYTQPETLKRLGFKPDIWQAWKNQKHFALALLAPSIKYQFDEINIRLLLEAEPQAFEPQFIRVQPKPITSEKALIKPEPLSAFLNYQLEGRNETQTWTFNVPWEIGLKYRDWLFYSNFSYQSEPQSVVRLLTNVTWDSTEHLERWVFGDFAPVSQTLSETAVVTGISVQRFFAQQPSFSSLPDLQLHQLLKHPANLEMYLNNELLDSWSVKPGRVVLTDFMQGVGQGQVRLKIKDILGNERFYHQSFLLNQSLLKPNLHDYIYQFGWERHNFGQQSQALGNWLLTGQHRYGVSEHLTANLAFAAKPQAHYLSPSLDWVWKGQLQSHWRGHYLKRGGRNSFATNVFMQYQARYFNLNVGIDAYSKHYATDDTDAALQQRIFTGLSLPNRKQWGSVSLFWEHNQYWQTETQQSFSINYQNKLFQNWHVLLSARYQQGAEQGVEVFAGFNYQFGKDWRLQARHSQTTGQQRNNLSLSKSAKRGLSQGYRLNVQQINNAEWQTNARWQSRWQQGVLDTQYQYSADTKSASLSWAGGVAWLPDAGIHFSRPINDSFALISANEVGIPIQMGEQLMGKTNAKGEVLLPELSAFYENRVKIDLQALPLNYSLQQSEQFIKPSYRSGSQVNFAIEKFTAVEGTLIFQQKAIEQMPMQLQINSKTIPAFIGKAGYFYLENLPIGKHSGRVTDKKIRCTFILDIADSKDIVQYLGDIICE